MRPLKDRNGCPRHFHGLRLSGLTLFSSFWYPNGRRVTIASWHNPAHMCWLWFIELSLTHADEHKTFRAYSLPGAQAWTTLQLWRLRISFCWQAEGWYSSPSEMRVRNLLGY